MKVFIANYFNFKELKTNFKTELIAGVTTFFTMAYIIIVNPKILEVAGIPLGPSIVATILTAAIGTLLMGVYAKKPFAIAPYMGENAFIAFTVVRVMGHSWQTALGAIFIGGVLFTLLTLFKIRSWLANAIPKSMEIAFSVGIGLFLAFIGLTITGIVTLGFPGAPVRIGNLTNPMIFLAIVGFFITSFFMIKKNKMAMLLGIALTTIIAFLFKIAPIPNEIMSIPPNISPIFLKLDILSALHWGFFSVILTIFIMDFVDTMGTLLGVSYKAGLLDTNGDLPEIEKPMLVDSLSTIIGALLGTSTAGTFIESASGVEAGGRSGFTAVVTSFLFILSLFFAPLFIAIPPCAYGPVLIIVGMLMLSPIKQLDFNDLTEIIPAFVIISVMSFTFNLGFGMTAGFITYPLIKTFGGKIKEVPLGLWIMALLSILFFVLYPY